MSKTDLLAIRNLKRSVRRAAGPRAAVVLAGSASLTPSTGKAAVTRWVCAAMERLDSSVDERTRTAVMRDCGRSCAARHAKAAEAMRRRREAAPSLDDFLAEETRRFGGGVRYERRGPLILHTYEPMSYRKPMRCYCGLTKGLKSGERISATFCECSAGFVESTWERILGGPVTVKLLESAVTGSKVCRFAVKPRGKRSGSA